MKWYDMAVANDCCVSWRAKRGWINSRVVNAVLLGVGASPDVDNGSDLGCTQILEKPLRDAQMGPWCD